MPRHQEELFRLFERKIYASGNVKPLSGWDFSIYPGSARNISITLTPNDLSRYNYEAELPNAAIEEGLERAGRILECDYGATLKRADIVMAPSMTSAIAVVLHWLRFRGVLSIIADPPYYFSYLNVAERLGLPFILARRTAEVKLESRPLLAAVTAARRPAAVILCDPRYVLGSNYSRDELEEILRQLATNDVLIIDHAMDLTRASITNINGLCRVVRLFGFGKTVAMNGARMAAIVAPGIAAELRTIAGAIFGSHDIAALKLFSSLLADSEYLAEQRRGVATLVYDNYKRYSSAYKHDRMRFVAPKNGILGYIHLELAVPGRYVFYKRLMNRSVHAMFGQHFGLDSNGVSDLLRINYLLDCRSALDEVAVALS